MAGNNYIKPISVKTFNCPNCASNVKVRVQGQSLTVVCMSCKSIIDTSDENLKILQKINDKKSRRQYIPFGARGVINDVIWEVIGYLEKKDVKYNFYWSEYLLFNPYKGYRWLAESDGHWNFFTTIKDKPFKKKSTQKYVVYDNKKFSIFNRGNIEVSYVMGEFYWKVRIGTISKASDYISPPYMLSSEELKSEIVWSKGVYVSPDEIKKTFNVEKVPSPYGVGPNQESPHIKNHTFVKKSYYLMLLLLFTFQSFFCFGSKGNVVYKSVFQFHGGDNDKPKKSGSFEVNADSKNMELKLASPVDNNWVEINIAMVNEKTGDTIEVIHGLEYYHGYSDGEKWTEGSQS
ncbi:MAG: DUF4178 domain-containing protein, partial [Leptospiraceae bacterium]|nr:DUF4178 domain-containing protein [Leptospiraceae bacterium]